jgi:hypothetical protein
VRRQSEQACRASTVQKRAPHTQNKENGRHSVLVRYAFLKKAQAKQTSTQDKHSAEQRQAHQQKMDSILSLSDIHSRRVHWRSKQAPRDDADERNFVLVGHSLAIRAQARQTNTQGRHSAEDCQAHTERKDGSISSLSDIHSLRRHRQSKQARKEGTM